MVSGASFLEECFAYGISLLDLVGVAKVLKRIYKVDGLDGDLVSKPGALAVYGCQHVETSTRMRH